MAAIDDLKTSLASLRALRASGVAMTQHGEVRTQYKTDAEMAAAQADLERQIAVLETVASKKKRRAFTAG